jgi:hypothetical protein
MVRALAKYVRMLTLHLVAVVCTTTEFGVLGIIFACLLHLVVDSRTTIWLWLPPSIANFKYYELGACLATKKSLAGGFPARDCTGINLNKMIVYIFFCVT